MLAIEPPGALVLTARPAISSASASSSANTPPEPAPALHPHPSKQELLDYHGSSARIVPADERRSA